LIFFPFNQDIDKELAAYEPRVESLLINGDTLVHKASEGAVQNLGKSLQNLQARWDNLKSRAGDRCRKLEDAVDQAEGFHVNLNKFIGWLTDTEKTLNNLKKVSYVLDHVKDQIEDHKVEKCIYQIFWDHLNFQ
jgi:uncharacterized protein YoxC